MNLAIVLLVAAAASPTPSAGPALALEAAPGLAAVSPAALSAGTRFLASDRLEGRGTATRGYDIAAL